nr:uncharacterized protein LOC113460659 [Zonotrichia albicollis]
MRVPPALHHARSLLCPRLPCNVIPSCLSAKASPQLCLPFPAPRTSRSLPSPFPAPISSQFSCTRAPNPGGARGQAHPKPQGHQRGQALHCSPCPGDAELLHPGQGAQGPRRIRRCLWDQHGVLRGFGPAPSEKPCLSKASAPGLRQRSENPKENTAQEVKQQRRAELSPPAGGGGTASSVRAPRAALGGGRDGAGTVHPPLPAFAPTPGLGAGTAGIASSSPLASLAPRPPPLLAPPLSDLAPRASVTEQRAAQAGSSSGTPGQLQEGICVPWFGVSWAPCPGMARGWAAGAVTSSSLPSGPL